MKDALTNHTLSYYAQILIANIFIVGSFLARDWISSLSMVIIGAMWLFLGIMNMRSQR